MLFEKESIEPDIMHEMIYEKVEIQTDNLMYNIRINDDITLEFEKVGHRMFKDSQGVEYFPQKYPEK